MEPLGTIYLLDEDPALLDLVPERFHAAARRAAAVPAYRLSAGIWDPGVLGRGGDSLFGLLVLDGLLLRDVVVAHTTCGELVGPGELLRPWDDFGTRAPTPLEIEWKVLSSARVAVLDREFSQILAAWPALMNEFVNRAIERSHSLALHVAIHCIRRVDVSLLVLFAHLADRFGKVTPNGVTVDIGLTHEDLGKLVGATRQSVSDALQQLASRQIIIRRDDKSWLLEPDLSDEIQSMLRRRQRRPPQ